MKIHNFLQRWC